MNQNAEVIAMPSKHADWDLADVISFLKDRDFSLFSFETDGSEAFAKVYINEIRELCIYNVSDHVIPEKTVRQVIDVLEHLDECIQKAYEWIRRLNLKNNRWFPGDKWYPHELDQIFEVTGLTFEKTGEEHHFYNPINRFEQLSLGQDPKKAADGFSIGFDFKDSIYSPLYPLSFFVKFICEDMRAYAIEAELN